MLLKWNCQWRKMCCPFPEVGLFIHFTFASWYIGLAVSQKSDQRFEAGCNLAIRRRKSYIYIWCSLTSCCFVPKIFLLFQRWTPQCFGWVIAVGQEMQVESNGLPENLEGNVELTVNQDLEIQKVDSKIEVLSLPSEWQSGIYICCLVSVDCLYWLFILWYLLVWGYHSKLVFDRAAEKGSIPFKISN